MLRAVTVSPASSMADLLHRTGTTCLSNDELILFDALFDVSDTFEALRRDEFQTAHNLPHTHGLDDGSLERTLSRLRANGLLRRRRSRRKSLRSGTPLTWYTLTAKGGSLWARERRPRWSRFCTDSSWPVQSSDRWLLSVQSPSLRTAKAFLAVATQCGLYDADPTTAVVRRHNDRRLVPWHVFRTVFELRLRLRRSESGTLFDPAAYERERNWWRSVVDLTTLADA